MPTGGCIYLRAVVAAAAAAPPPPAETATAAAADVVVAKKGCLGLEWLFRKHWHEHEYVYEYANARKDRPGRAARIHRAASPSTPRQGRGWGIWCAVGSA